MKNYFKFSMKSVLLTAAVVVFASCNDTWKDHYSFKETESSHPVAKLAETLGSISGYENFLKALETTQMCDKYGRPQGITFMDLLSEDQFLTVWAPSNNCGITQDEWKEYTNPKKSAAQHYEVGEKFIKNHIARFKHTVGASSSGKIYMLSGKAFTSAPNAIGGKSYDANEKNIRCSNGILHCINGHLEYLKSLYEYITQAPEYKDIFGDWFKSFTIETLDLEKSIASGMNDQGEIVYVDSVMIESNQLMRRFGYIHTEDSTYAIVMPTPELFNNVYDRIKESYVYAEKNLNNDSLQQYYTRVTMMTDMFYNMNPKVQKYYPDSVFSTLYNSTENRRDGKPYHIFSHPNEAGGLFANAISTEECSNGTIYFVDEWPFVDTLTYLRQIKLEAESYTALARFMLRQQSVNSIKGKRLDNPVQVMRISMEGMSSWDAKIYINDNLKGKYEVKMVMAPNSVADMPNYIHPAISYVMPDNKEEVLIDSVRIDTIVDSRGRKRAVRSPFYAINDTSKFDTVSLGIVDLPYCNYEMNQARLAVTLSSGVNEQNSSKYASELWLDCLILDPVVE